MKTIGQVAKARQKHEYYLANREKILARTHKYKAENKERIAVRNNRYNAAHRQERTAYIKQYREAHPEHGRNRHLLERFGITLNERNELYDIQRGKCALCGGEMERDGGKNTGTGAVVDHNHETDKVRGLIHGKCNVLLGIVSDDSGLLEKAIIYLKKGGLA